MTTSVAPRVRVSAPGGTPSRFGLFAAANVIDGVDGHELMGVEYDAHCSVPVDLWPVPCADTVYPPRPAFTVRLTKPAGQDLLVGQLIQRLDGYVDAEVMVDVDGDVKEFGEVGDVQTWVVVPAANLDLEAVNTANGADFPQCSDDAVFLVPGTEGTGEVTLSCTIPSLYENAANKQPRRTLANVGVGPFGVVAAEDCHPIGRDANDARAQLRARLLAGEQAAVERAIWTGEVGNGPALALAAETLVGGEPRELLDAIGLLEKWIAETTGQVGVLHAPRWLAPRLAIANQANTSGARATTPLGTVWSLGAGYPGTGPDGTPVDDDALWLYATGPVTVRRSPVIEPADWSSGAFNTRTNKPFLLAERIYLVDWPCPPAAVRTTLSRADFVPVPTPEELTP
jgi:hypothetical protein